MFFENIISNSNKKPKKISDFFDDTQLKSEQMLNICDKAINDRIKIGNKNKFNDNVFTDLEILYKDSVFNVINKTKTNFGNICLKNIIKSPSHDISELNSRQNILKVFLENTQLYDDLCKYFDELSNLEIPILWLFKDRTKEELQII